MVFRNGGGWRAWIVQFGHFFFFFPRPQPFQLVHPNIFFFHSIYKLSATGLFESYVLCFPRPTPSPIHPPEGAFLPKGSPSVLPRFVPTLLSPFCSCFFFFFFQSPHALIPKDLKESMRRIAVVCVLPPFFFFFATPSPPMFVKIVSPDVVPCRCSPPFLYLLPKHFFFFRNTRGLIISF